MLKKYYAPEGAQGQVNRGTESYPIVDGVVALPSDLAAELGLEEAKPIDVKTEDGGKGNGKKK